VDGVGDEHFAGGQQLVPADPRHADAQARQAGRAQHDSPGHAGQQPPVRGRSVQYPADHSENVRPVGLQHVTVNVLDQQLLAGPQAHGAGQIRQQPPVGPLVRAEAAFDNRRPQA